MHIVPCQKWVKRQRRNFVPGSASLVKYVCFITLWAQQVCIQICGSVSHFLLEFFDNEKTLQNELLMVYGIKFQNLGEPKIAIFKWLQNHDTVSDFAQIFFMNYKMLFLELYKFFISQVDNWELLSQLSTFLKTSIMRKLSTFSTIRHTVYTKRKP